MKLIAYYSMLYGAGIILQFVLSKYLSLWGFFPNLLLLSVVFIAIKRGSRSGQILGFFWGLSWDVIEVGLFGSSTLLLTCAGFVSGKLRKKLDDSKVPTQIVIAVIVSMFFWYGKELLSMIFSPYGTVFTFSSGVLVQTVYNALVAPVVFVFCEWFVSQVYSRERSF